MFRSQDPVGAMRLLINLNLHETVFPIPVTSDEDTLAIFERGLHLLSITHDHLCECKSNTPIWCESKRAAKAAMYGANENILINDDEARRKLWYAAFLKPFQQFAQSPSASNLSKRKQGRKANRSLIMKLMVDDLKRPLRDAEAVERIMKAADEITLLIDSGCDLSATTVLLSEVRVTNDADGKITCSMGNRIIEADVEEDPIWLHAMEYRLLASGFLRKVGSLWRAALILSLSEQLAQAEQKFSYTIEGDVFDETSVEIKEGIIQQYDCFAASLQQLGLVGVWSQKPLLDGVEMKNKDILPNIPKGPIFRDIMDKQLNWMTITPGGSKESLVHYLRESYPDFT